MVPRVLCFGSIEWIVNTRVPIGVRTRIPRTVSHRSLPSDLDLSDRAKIEI